MIASCAVSYNSTSIALSRTDGVFSKTKRGSMVSQTGLRPAILPPNRSHYSLHLLEIFILPVSYLALLFFGSCQELSALSTLFSEIQSLQHPVPRCLFSWNFQGCITVYLSRFLPKLSLGHNDSTSLSARRQTLFIFIAVSRSNSVIISQQLCSVNNFFDFFLPSNLISFKR